MEDTVAEPQQQTGLTCELCCGLRSSLVPCLWLPDLLE